MTKFNLDKLHEIAEPRKLSRAEEMALEAYPRDEDRELNYRRANYRIAYERGYKQAEKDTIAEVEKWLKANFHHRNCWNEDEFCVSLRTYFGIEK